jgi:hypothetical protein
MFGFKKKPEKESPDKGSSLPSAPMDDSAETNTAATDNSNNNNQVKLQVDVQVLKDGNTTSGADWVGSIDQGTSSTRFLVFTKAGKIAASAQMEHQQIFPEGEDKVCLIQNVISECGGSYILVWSFSRSRVSCLLFFKHRLVGTNTIRSRFGPIPSLAFKPSWKRCRNVVSTLTKPAARDLRR